MEGVKTDEEIEREITSNMAIVQDKLNVTTKYFRPPYGTIGSRTRQALGRHSPNAEIIMWSIDVKDWGYGIQPDGHPEAKQLQAFKDDFDKGGDIVVMHYLYKSTVDQFREMIRYAKANGRKFVRMDQCIGDPKAPESWGWKRS